MVWCTVPRYDMICYVKYGQVDDDIEGVDEKAESALADFELLDK